jgi:proline iminopeptidase
MPFVIASDPSSPSFQVRDLGAPPGVNDDRQEERRKLRESGLREADLAAYQRRLFELSVVPYFHDPTRARDLTAFRLAGRTQQEVWESLGNFDLRPALRSRGKPALVLHGESDPIPLDVAREAAECVGAGFHQVDRCGHVPYVERPDAFREVVGGWL